MEFKNNSIILFLTNLSTFRSYYKFFFLFPKKKNNVIISQPILNLTQKVRIFLVNQDIKPEKEPFLSSNDPNVESQGEENSCEDWVTEKRYYDFFITFQTKDDEDE